MKMSIEQKAAYQAYRAECRISNVEPVRADFLAGDIPSCVSYHLLRAGVELPTLTKDFLAEEELWGATPALAAQAAHA